MSRREPIRRPGRPTGIGNTYESQPGLRTASWLALVERAQGWQGETAMSSQAELCEHHAQDCLQAAEQTEDPWAREMLLRQALEWMRDGLAASKQSKLCAVCGRKMVPGSSLVH
jgi:hypothetical protein